MRVSQRGVTLLELLFVCGIFVVVLTILAMSLRQTVASQQQLDQGSEALVNLELSRLKLSALLRRSEWGAPVDKEVPQDHLVLRLYQMENGRPVLNAAGEPQPGEIGTLIMDGEGNLIVEGLSEPLLVSRLGSGAELQVTRISESRCRFRLTAPDGESEPRVLTFEAGF